MLCRAGAILIDADKIARQVVSPGCEAWRQIRDVFGGRVLRPDGSLDRKRLGDMVFQDPFLRKQLEQIIHPRVRSDIADQLARICRTAPDALVVQDVPLLIETGMHSGLDEIIVVYVPAHIQLQRLMRRDGLTHRQALDRISSQMAMEEKRKIASIVIDNSGSIDSTECQVQKIYRQLHRQAAARSCRRDALFKKD
jgi:dephospho-CoA kinase